jgi:hypothetical protein
MKKFVAFVMVLALVFLVGCPKKEKEIEKIAEILPENTEVLVKFSSFEAIHKNSAMTDTSVLGQPIEGLEDIKEALGFNPFNLEELKAHGFNPAKEFGFLVTDIIVEESGAEPNFTGLVFVPVTDEKKAVETIKTAIQKESPDVKITEEEDITVFEKAGDDVKLYMAEKGKYLFIGANPKVDAKPFIQSILSGEAFLTQGKNYQDVVTKMSPEEEVFVYANIGKILEKNLENIKNLSKQSARPGAPDMSATLDSLSGYQGAGISLDLESPNFVLKSVANIAAESRLLKLLEGAQMNKNAVLGLPEHPVLLISAALNASEYYKLFVEALPEEEANNVKMQLEGMKSMTGIDIENDVINNIAGNLNLGVYDGGSITMGSFNTLITLTVKDEAVMKGVLEKVIAMLPPPQQEMVSQQTVGDTEAYVVMAPMLPVQIYVGIKDNTLIVAAGKPMFEKALKGDVSSGFTAQIEEKELVETLKSDGSVLYINADETMKAAKNFEMFLSGFTGGEGIDPKIQDAVSKFEYILASNKLDGTTVSGELIIKTKFTEPFFIEVEKLSKSFTQ